MNAARIFIYSLAVLLGTANAGLAQPTFIRQRVYTYPFAVGETLTRLSPSRLLGIGAQQRGIGDTIDRAARLCFYNNQDDTVGTIAHYRRRQIASQQLFPAFFSYTGLSRTHNGNFLLNGNHVRGSVNGVVVPAESFLSRVDSLGTIQWTRNYTFSGQPADGRLIGLPDDGAIALGAIARGSGPIFASVVVASQFDSLGNVGWQRIVGRSYSTVNRIATLPDGTYALAGYEARVMPGTNTTREDGWLIRITASGDTLGTRYFGTPAQYDTWQDVRATPHHGLLLTGVVGTGSTQEQGLVTQLDSLGQVQWQQRIPATLGSTTPNCVLLHGLPLLNGDVLVNGYRLVPGSLTQTQNTYQAVYRPNAAGGASAVWERITSTNANEPFSRNLDLSAAGELTISGNISPPANTFYSPHSHLRLQLTERPYVPDLCQTPPQALFGYAPMPGGDSLRLTNLSSAGPRYAQLLRWRWNFGDGTRYDGPAPPPHRYPAGTAAATAVRLTVTNNLGCTSTTVVYPFALATAAQRALQAQLSVFPNPALAGAATVRLPGLRPQPAVTGELLNALGQVVRRGSWPAAALVVQGAVLDLAGLAPGIYTLRLRPQEGALVKRVVVP